MNLKRKIWPVLLVILLSGICAYATVIFFARGRPSSAPEAVEGFGVFERLRLPTAAMALKEIKSLKINVADVDDFARIYVNNYMVFESSIDALFGLDKSKGSAFKNFSDSITQRGNPSNNQIDARRLLRPGINVIVVELENSMLGGCRMQLSMSVNDINFEGFPRIIPGDFHFDRGAMNDRLVSKFQSFARHDYENDEMTINDVGDALCSRWFFSFEAP